MTLKLITAATVACIAMSTFAANTATVNVSANVQTGAEIQGMPTLIDFGNVAPTAVQAGTIPANTSASVDVYDNNPATGLQVQTNCTANNGGNGCYICKDGNCAASNERVLVQCSYTSCTPSGGTATTFVVTPGSSDANPFTSSTTIPSANSSEAACDTTAGGAKGTLVCALQPTVAMPVSGGYTGSMVFTASDA